MNNNNLSNSMINNVNTLSNNMVTNQGFNTDHNILYLHVDPNCKELIDQYIMHIDHHNNSMANDPYPNSGFDLFFPSQTDFTTITTKFVDFRVKCEMRTFNQSKQQWTPTAFLVHPRSSISKTPLMLANHTGIIDSGYRGFLVGAFRYLGNLNSGYTVAQHNKLLQICSADLRPIFVKMVDAEFFENTSRGGGGFGSTG